MRALQQSLAPFGAEAADVIAFDESPEPDSIRYVSLFQAREHLSVLSRVAGVLSWQGDPFVYVVEAEGLADDDLRRLRRALALRGDAPHLALLTPGRLVIHRLGLDALTPKASMLCDVRADEPTSLLTFAELSAAPSAKQSQQKAVSALLFTLLTKALKLLLASAQLHRDDALSLVGRALFLRFLYDRRRLPLAWGDDPGALFQSAVAAQRASDWLDRTFNGDLLPLRPESWAALDEASLSPLRDILRGERDGQLSLSWSSESWLHLHFGHIPVGVLSEVYERFIHVADPQLAAASGVHYTPWRIAERLMAESFAALRRGGRAAEARVLDPAAGAGVFLQLCFRQLVAERTRRDGVRPDGPTLRRILAEQVHGLDVMEGALRFAALALYLSCIELEPTPTPEDALRFPNLRQTSLTLVPRETGGGLSEEVTARHRGRYDLVIGNPPWTSSSRASTAPVKTAARDVLAAAARRLGRPTVLPGLQPDLAFLWRAMEWARDDGQIALAMSGKLLHQQTEGLPQARADVWEALDVTGVVSGAKLAGTKVWPNMDADFCLVFAKNRRPNARSATLVLCPEPEPDLNRSGRLRLSPDQARWARPDDVAARPELFKVYSRGTALDLAILARLPPAETLGSLSAARRMFSGNGFQRIRESSVIRRGQTAPGIDASSLRETPTLIAESGRQVHVQRALLDPFEKIVPKLRVHRARDLSLYRGPLLLVSVSPKADVCRLDVRVSDGDLVFDQDFFGWSAADQPDAALLVRTLALQLLSPVALWLALMRSGSFGVMRRVLEKPTLDALPVIPPQRLSPHQRAQVLPLWARVSADPDAADTRAELARWSADLHGLSTDELGVIQDTLSVGLPFERSQDRARELVTGLPAAFLDALLETLAPWAEDEGKAVLVNPIDALPPSSLWRVFELICPELGPELGIASEAAEGTDWLALVSMADACGVSELIVPGGSPGRLRVARLAFGAGWTRSRGVLFARRVIDEHLEALLGPST